MSAPDWLENAVLTHIQNGTALSQPTTLYLALCQTAPTDSAQGTEILTPATNDYDREAISWNSPSGGSMDNSAEITFGDPSTGFGADPANATDFMITDHLTATAVTNMWFYGALGTAKDAGAGDKIVVATGALIISVT